MNKTLVCEQGCTSDMTTVLKSVLVIDVGRVDLHVVFTNHTPEEIDIVFDPQDTLTDSGGNTANAYANPGGTGYIAVPANGSTAYTISFDGLSPAQGTTCTFDSDIEQGGAWTVYYQDVKVTCR